MNGYNVVLLRLKCRFDSCWSRHSQNLRRPLTTS
nr:MAG TPA: hypothetical protein [Caudoviricetes sp.]